MVSKQDILSMLEQVKIDGFDIHVIKDEYIEFINIKSDRILSFGPGSILRGLFRGCKADVSFFSVEQVLRPAFAKDKDISYSVTLTTDNHATLLQKPIGQGVYEHLPLTLDSNEALEKAKILISRFIEQDALPFFEYWKDIRAFLPFLETVEGGNLHEVFYNDALFKKIIIWKLCSHPKYQTFVDERTQKIEKAVAAKASDPFAQKNLKRYTQLIKSLEKTPVLYEWDESYLHRK